MDDDRKRIFEKGEELGRLIAQTAEYSYLQAAHREIGDDREATESLNRLRELQSSVLGSIERGEEPPPELERELAELQETIQVSSRYEALISAQSNFDKLMEKIHRSIGRGIRKGEESRIIIPS
ncbi:MAG: YlbF family regulator [Gemmatimonadota bacterium]